MDPKVKEAIFRAVETETFAQALNMELVDLELGYSAVEMTYDPSAMNNIYDVQSGTGKASACRSAPSQPDQKNSRF